MKKKKKEKKMYDNPVMHPVCEQKKEDKIQNQEPAWFSHVP